MGIIQNHKIVYPGRLTEGKNKKRLKTKNQKGNRVRLTRVEGRFTNKLGNGADEFESFYEGVDVMKEMTIDILKSKLEEIKGLNFVPTHRSGDTGIGKTLEDLLGIKENNVPLCDIGKEAELKAYRKDAKSMLTLFTLEPKPKGGDRDRFLLDTFGYTKRKNSRSKELHSTVTAIDYNNQDLKLSVEKDKIRVVATGCELDVFWDIDILKQKFNEKLPALVYVLADRKIISNKEVFHFNEAYFLSGFDFKHFKEMVRNGFIVADFRMYYKPNGSVRNHGTGFRVKINKLYDCFKKKVRLI